MPQFPQVVLGTKVVRGAQLSPGVGVGTIVQHMAGTGGAGSRIMGTGEGIGSSPPAIAGDEAAIPKAAIAASITRG